MVKAVKRRSVSSVRSSYNTRRLHTVYRVTLWMPGCPPLATGALVLCALAVCYILHAQTTVTTPNSTGIALKSVVMCVF